ncbi:MAG: QueT transporter family protein [Acutalibacteraceae bacterium]
MKEKKRSTHYLAQSAVIAALYAAATYLSAAFSLAYGPIQFRLSEALTVLAVLTPAAIPGLTVGCAIGNISSPMGIWDVLFGAAATLLSAVCARALRNVQFKKLPILSSSMPVLFNAVIVGLEIVLLTPTDGAKLTAFLISALEVGAGELVVCFALGLPLYSALRRTKLFK